MRRIEIVAQGWLLSLRWWPAKTWAYAGRDGVSLGCYTFSVHVGRTRQTGPGARWEWNRLVRLMPNPTVGELRFLDCVRAIFR